MIRFKIWTASQHSVQPTHPAWKTRAIHLRAIHRLREFSIRSAREEVFARRHATKDRAKFRRDKSDRTDDKTVCETSREDLGNRVAVLAREMPEYASGQIAATSQRR
jgi:hypothetical protein